MCQITAALLLVLHALGATGTTQADEHKASAIRAYLYYHDLGEIDSREIFTSGLALWNTNIGEGDAKVPTQTVLIEVGVTGPYGDPKSTVVLDFLAQTDTVTVAASSVDITSYFDLGGAYIPFIVYNINVCLPLKITASTRCDGSETSRVSDTVFFDCGE